MQTMTQRVYYILREMQHTEGLEPLKRLFWTELNYNRANQPVSTRNWPAGATQVLAEDPTLFATAGGELGGFKVIYCRLNGDLLITPQRPVIMQFLEKEGEHGLYIFSNEGQTHWHFVNVKYDKDTTRRRLFRRIKIGPEERLRTAAERLALLDPTALGTDLFGISPLAIQQRHDDAFDVEAVTKHFFGAYVQVFQELQEALAGQTGDLAWAHDYALQLLNRIMFLYFVQRKRWLGNDPDFLAGFWQAYREQAGGTDTFYEQWLQVLFFEAFNNQFQADRADRQHLPEHIRQALAMAPYLNGGLFERSDLDRKYTAQIDDEQFARIFTFFEGYNFTISEDTPLDQEVAVDPEMIGKVYESLVNVSEEADERGGAGIFYTPRTEIDLMCRLSLVDWLTNHLSAETKPLLYEVVFAFSDDEKQEADARVSEQDLWPTLYELLSSVQVVDPACGSGSFLVGMLLVLDDLLRRAERELGIDRESYDRRKEIIGSSLYGVDVMEWAVHVAELRLWLQLVIETKIHPTQLKFKPLLPNLSFKLRVGDSLVQEVGGINLGLRHQRAVMPPALKGRITHLKGEKLKFYRNDPDREYKTVEALHHAELQLFRDILSDRETTLVARIKAIERDWLQGEQQLSLMEVTATDPLAAERQNKQTEHDQLVADLEQVQASLRALRRAQDVPLVWDIAFVEVFEGDNTGFDIVIGNPPYVRQEKIAPPYEQEGDYSLGDWRAMKRAYKDKLMRSVYAAFPRTFGYRVEQDRAAWRLDAKSDLYIYFYFHGLSLLNPQGGFCFITSNSWLDVGYGADLQQFLLTRGQVKLVIDNQVKRSFVSAQVNTVIVLLGPARDSATKHAESLAHTAHFALLRVPFEVVLSPIIWQEVEETAEQHSTPEYRVFPRNQAQLLTGGTDQNTGTFVGDKWGGKYLRAPDIYWTVIERAKDRLVRLGNVAEVTYGIKTGANEFFFLDQEQIATWGVEAEFLVPALKNVREVDRVVVDSTSFPLRLFVCNQARATLRGTAALEYIKWGEGHGFHQRPSCSGRSHWWSLGDLEPVSINCNYQIGYVQHFLVSSRPFLVSDNFQCIDYPEAPYSLAAALNSTWAQLYVSMMGRTNFGGGLLKIQTYETADIITVDPAVLDEDMARKALAEAGILELGGEDRRRLDEMVFDALGLTQGERDAVYEELVKLVEARLQRAQSV